MKNLFIALALVAVLASCNSTPAPTATSNDSTAVDTVKVDTVKVDTAKAVAIDTTKK